MKYLKSVLLKKVHVKPINCRVLSYTINHNPQFWWIRKKVCNSLRINAMVVIWFVWSYSIKFNYNDYSLCGQRKKYLDQKFVIYLLLPKLKILGLILFLMLENSPIVLAVCSALHTIFLHFPLDFIGLNIWFLVQPVIIVIIVNPSSRTAYV